MENLNGIFWFSLLGRARFAAEINYFSAHRRTNHLVRFIVVVVVEVTRIRNEHLDHACVVINDRVKGLLKVTRAFGAGFLKQASNKKAMEDIGVKRLWSTLVE
ncbi:phosphatase 2C family protein [Striga asiatica]|uniref:Phosphatase 2C family protein n=1 Tax=Striga asiatica TaxID=4170 RepID=A0A5A7QKW0_STRAF|nr:phosphatase 2C family protein [Striga asiatica]